MAGAEGGGRAPTPAEVAAIIAAAGEAREFKGTRNRAFFTLLFETGSRTNSLRGLTGDAVIVLQNGRMRLMLHAKGQVAPHEVELSDRAAALLRDYVTAFNRQAIIAGRSERITLGEPGQVWRSSWGTQWAYRSVAQAFERACLAIGTQAYTLHSYGQRHLADVPLQIRAVTGHVASDGTGGTLAGDVRDGGRREPVPVAFIALALARREAEPLRRPHVLAHRRARVPQRTGDATEVFARVPLHQNLLDIGHGHPPARHIHPRFRPGEHAAPPLSAGTWQFLVISPVAISSDQPRPLAGKLSRSVTNGPPRSRR